MAYLLHILDDDGRFELIDEDFIELGLYDFDEATLTALSEEQAQQLLSMGDLSTLRYKHDEFVDLRAKPTADEVLATQREVIKTAINAKRDSVSYAGVFVESLGKYFDSDETSFTKMLGVKAVMDDDAENGGEVETTVWVCADNSVISLSRDDLMAVIKAIKEHFTTTHTTAIYHKKMLEQAENPSEYDYSTGWAKTYADFVAEQQTE